MERLIGVYGASGYGREVMPLVKSQWGRDHKILFIDDGEEDSQINGYRVVNWDSFLKLKTDVRQVVIAIGDGNIRERLATKCQQNSIALIEARAANVVEMDNVDIGEGAVFSPFTTLTSNIVIGRCFHANIYSYVAHDCMIGDYVTFAPAVRCNGNVVIEDYAYIGTGAILRQGKPGAPLVIGKGAVIGMGAVVTKNVAPGEIMVGNPARPMTRPSG